MINLTIVKLSAIFLAGSPFSFSPSIGVHSFSIDDSFFSRSLHSLLYFNIFSGKTQITKTIFNNIIGGSIRVESAYEVKDQVILKRFSPNIMEGNYYIFESCMFRNCHCTGEKLNGGAVNINVPSLKEFEVDLSFEFCSFYNCYSAGGYGGAVYGFHIGDVSILETCFNTCFTRESSLTGNIGIGTAVYISHLTSTGRTRGRFSSYTECPKEAAKFPNTEDVFHVSSGKVDLTHSNFSNNVVEFGSSAIHLNEQAYCIIAFTTCRECIGESTISIVGMNDATCDIDTLNFVDCVNHSEDKVLYGIFTILYTKVTVEQSVFIMKNNKFLAMRDKSDSFSTVKFSKCIFDRASDDLYNGKICSFIDKFF